MAKLILKSKRPKFEIAVDRYQWILRADTVMYFPNLSNLLDELAEHFFRKNAKKIKDIKNLEKVITKVYGLIDKIGEKFEKLKEDN